MSNLIENMKHNVVFHNYIMNFNNEKSTNIILDRVRKFQKALASRGQSAEFYKDKRNAHYEKVAEEIAVGKYAEWLAGYTLYKFGFPKLFPEDQVRVGAGKGWEKDFSFSQLDSSLPDCHLKNTPRRYGKDLSWTFQLRNKDGVGGRDPLFDSPDSNDLIIMTYVSSLNDTKATLCYTAPWRILYPILKDPFKSNLVGLKKCVYESDLQKLIQNSLV